MDSPKHGGRRITPRANRDVQPSSVGQPFVAIYFLRFSGR